MTRWFQSHKNTRKMINLTEKEKKFTSVPKSKADGGEKSNKHNKN